MIDTKDLRERWARAHHVEGFDYAEQAFDAITQLEEQAAKDATTIATLQATISELREEIVGHEAVIDRLQHGG